LSPARRARRAALAPAPAALRAEHAARRLELEGAAEHRRPERDLHGRARVGRHPRAASPASHSPEEVPEDPAEVLELRPAPPAAEIEVREIEAPGALGRLFHPGSCVAE